MKPNRLKQLWREGKPAFGMWADLGSTASVEAMSLLGLDWICLDGEHGMEGYEGLLPLMQAMSASPAAAIVRVPASDYIAIKRVLDMGADGVLVPQVRTAEEVKRIADWCRYPPAGTRGIGPFRASKYELEFMDYFNNANAEIVCSVQIENRDGFKNLDEILKVPGVDAIFTGPADLALDMGHFPNILHPEVQRAIQEIYDKSTAAGKPVGFYCTSGKEAKKLAERGYKYLSICNDMTVLAFGMRKQAREARGDSGEETPDLVMS